MKNELIFASKCFSALKTVKFTVGLHIIELKKDIKVSTEHVQIYIAKNLINFVSAPT